jgi:outer membrane protein assembly factor BamB
MPFGVGASNSTKGIEKKMRNNCLFRHIMNILMVGHIFLLVVTGCTNSPTPAHPATSLPSLYTLNQNGLVESIQADGKLHWQYDAFSDDTQAQSQFALVGSTMYVAMNALLAIATTTGKLLWRQPLSDAASALLVNDATIYVATQDHHIFALSAHDGSLLWQQSVQTGGFAPINQLALASSLLLVSEGSQVIALSLSNGKQQWANADLGPGEIIRKLWPNSGNVVVVQADASIEALRVSDGKQLWKQDVEIRAMNILQGTLYAVFQPISASLSDPTGICALRVEDGTRLWQVLTLVGADGSGSITSNGIYWENANTFTAWSLDGRQRWQLPMINQITTMTTQAGQVFAATDQGEIVRIDDQNGKLQWHTDIAADQLRIQGQYLWATQNQDKFGTLVGLDTKSGQARWNITAGGPVIQFAVV